MWWKAENEVLESLTYEDFYRDTDPDGFQLVLSREVQKPSDDSVVTFCLYRATATNLAVADTTAAHEKLTKYFQAAGALPVSSETERRVAETHQAHLVVMANDVRAALKKIKPAP